MDKCRTLLFMPGNNPGMLAGSQNLGADVVIFDLEDATAQTEKDAARNLVRHALTFIQDRKAPIMVRINGTDTPFWQDDLQAAVAGGADSILLPKCINSQQIIDISNFMETLEKKVGIKTPVALYGIIESAVGVENLYSIATAHKRLQGLLMGAEDLTADLGSRRTPAGQEIFYARSRIIMACKAAGIKVFDTPFPFVNDLENLKIDADFAVQLGFDGKAVISPHHVDAVNKAFKPDEAQVQWAQRVLAVADKAEREGKGAVSLDGMMIDLPIIKRARRILSFI